MKKIFISIINLYQLCVSPLSSPVCRYIPTCSVYAKDAIERYGLIKGLFLTILRLLRCHPFHPGGYDPVKKNLNSNSGL
ncbi:MAG: membrane protein insertion efficiency factor YidD [Nitrospirota bacterium]